MRRYAAAGLTIAVLAGCSEPRVMIEDLSLQPIDGMYEYGAADRDLSLVVSGNPFRTDPALLAAAVERGMDGASQMQPPVRPRLAPGDSARANYQLAVAFQPGSLDGPSLCAGGMGKNNPADMVTVEVAFCVSGRAIRYASGSVSASGPDDPAFLFLMKQVAQAVFRRDEPKWQTGGGDASR